VSLIESDQLFIAQANYAFSSLEATFTPGLIHEVNTWCKNQIGVPLFTRFDASEKPLSRDLLVGVALPTKFDNTEHIVVLISGRKLLIQPRDKEALPVYTDLLSDDRKGIDFETVTDLGQIADVGFDNEVLGSTVVMTNESVKGGEFIEALIPHALEVGQNLADKRRMIRRILSR
jgi:hypothetical protein